MCRRDFPITLMGIADVLASTLACTTVADALAHYSLLYVPQRRPVNFSHRPMGKLLTRLPQLTLAQLWLMLWSTIQIVHAAETFNVSHRSDGKIADMLASTLACATVNALVNYTEGACHRDLIISRCPHGRLTCFANVSRLVLTGRWCRCHWRHCGHLIVHHQWEYSWLCARSCSKVPIAPM
jgi:hypothetical protein